MDSTSISTPAFAVSNRTFRCQSTPCACGTTRSKSTCPDTFRRHGTCTLLPPRFDPVGERAVKHVRKFLGQRLRALRKQHGLSQERLGERAGLSGKFIGEVERGEKSISIDSLYHVAVALEIPLRELTDVRPHPPASVPTQEAEKVFALVAGRRRPGDLLQAYRGLPAIVRRGDEPAERR